MRRRSQGGLLLLPVVLAVATVAALAWLLSRQGALEARMAAGDREAEVARYVAEAGYHHARWRLKQTGCGGTPGLPPTPFGPHGYSAIFTPVGPARMAIAATGALASGVTRTVTRQVAVAATPVIAVLQPGPGEGRATYLDDGQTFTNFGSEMRVRVSNKTNAKDHALLRFGLGTIPAAAAVSSAVLELNLEGIGSANSGQIFVHRVTRAWAQHQATWLLRETGASWSTPGGDHRSEAVASAPVDHLAPGWRQWDVTPLVAAWLAGTVSNYGMMLKASLGLNHADFTTNEAPAAALHPKLTVTYSCPCGVSCVSGYYRDEFRQRVCDPAVDYAGSDGPLDWSGQPWQEVEETTDSCSGALRIENDLGGNRLLLRGDNKSIQRAADLSGFDTARLSFVYRHVEFDGDEHVSVQVWDPGGGAWTEVGRIQGVGTLPAYQSVEYDISAWASVASAIRFVAVGLTTSGSSIDEVWVDDVQIDRQAVAPLPATLVLAPTADTRIHENDPSANYGSDSRLRVGLDAGEKHYRSLLRFDVSGLPATATVTKATLRTHVVGSFGSKNTDASMHRVLVAWNETGTWSSLGGGAHEPTVLSETTVPTGTTGWVTWSIPPGLVHAWRDGVTPNHGLLLKPTPTSRKNNLFEPASREHGTSAWRPELVLEYVMP